MNELTIPADEITRTLTLKVRISRRFAARMWAAAQICRFAAYIAGTKFEVELIDPAESGMAA